MAQTTKQKYIDYWRTAWRERPRSRFFAPYRAIPSVLAAVAQFMAKNFRGRGASLSDMWLAIGIIIGVYLFLYAIESLSQFAVVSPVNLDTRAAETSARLEVEKAELMAQNARLKADLNEPKVSSLEQRRRKNVLETLQKFKPETVSVIQHILDHGSVHKFGVEVAQKFPHLVFKVAVHHGIVNGLVVLNGKHFTINPEIKSALEFVLSQEFSHGITAKPLTASIGVPLNKPDIRKQIILELADHYEQGSRNTFLTVNYTGAAEEDSQLRHVIAELEAEGSIQTGHTKTDIRFTKKGYDDFHDYIAGFRNQSS